MVLAFAYWCKYLSNLGPNNVSGVRYGFILGLLIHSLVFLSITVLISLIVYFFNILAINFLYSSINIKLELVL